MKTVIVMMIACLFILPSPTYSADRDEWDPHDDDFGGATDLGTPSNIIQSHGPHYLNYGIGSYDFDNSDWFRFALIEGNRSASGSEKKERK